MIAIKAHFDGKVFVPDEPVDLPKDAAVTVRVEHKAQATEDKAALLEKLKRKHPWVGAWEGKIHMTKDFDEPLEEFKDYM